MARSFLWLTERQRLEAGRQRIKTRDWKEKRRKMEGGRWKVEEKKGADQLAFSNSVSRQFSAYLFLVYSHLLYPHFRRAGSKTNELFSYCLLLSENTSSIIIRVAPHIDCT
jgi:hypothetical protein